MGNNIIWSISELFEIGKSGKFLQGESFTTPCAIYACAQEQALHISAVFNGKSKVERSRRAQEGIQQVVTEFVDRMV